MNLPKQDNTQIAVPRWPLSWFLCSKSAARI